MHEAFPVIVIFYCCSILLINEDEVSRNELLNPTNDKYLIELAFQGSFEVL